MTTLRCWYFIPTLSKLLFTLQNKCAVKIQKASCLFHLHWTFILQIRCHKLRRLKWEELKLKVLGDSNGGWCRVRWQVSSFNFLGDFSCNLIQQDEILSKRHYLLPFDFMALPGKWIHNYRQYIITYQFIISAFLLTDWGCQINTESLEKASKNEEGNNF